MKRIKPKTLLNTVLGPSPDVSSVKTLYAYLFVRGGADEVSYMTDQEFLGRIASKNNIEIPRISNKEVQGLFANKAKTKLTKNQRLIKSIIDHAKISV